MSKVVMDACAAWTYTGKLWSNDVGSPETQWSVCLGQARSLRSVRLVWSIWFIWWVSSNQTHETDRIDQTDEIDQMNKTGWQTVSASCQVKTFSL